MTTPLHTNRLIEETSPYLLQHAHNPVDWFPWGEEAFRIARETNRPVLLSVGYSACHWCHVMERESFENSDIADIMNRYFVNVKVDREERPDVDAIYMTAVQLLTGQGGWPMTVFLAPDGKPFYGGTYFPPQDMYGKPGFPRLLYAIAEAWTSRRGELEQQGADIAKALATESDLGSRASGELLTTSMLDTAYSKLAQRFDSTHGGFGGAPKFPQPDTLNFLLKLHARTRRQDPLDMVEKTLHGMALGGMYDQLGGGFHRYSTDATWLAPHFEKMLYDNAQLVQTYARAYQITRKAFYRGVAEETLEYVLREMTSAEGGFYSAQDAD
ncbi:MAG: thioredoxin domain-containing protein, partial [Armatimonadetes bacterium]|nr:thioredoxin domain-containing protein [Armatimonadota bacterium]